MTSRLPLVVANWKLNGSYELLSESVDGLQQLDSTKVEPILCPPYVYLGTNTQEVIKGAQSIAAQDAGAYTGEISGKMLREVGCRYVIVGHSERRTMFNESDEIVAEKVLATLNAGLIPIICFGEPESERLIGNAEVYIDKQVRAVMDKLPSLSDSIVLAYEPLWAIGTGKTATVEQAEQMHQVIRNILASYNQELAGTTRIIYGGSVNPANSERIFASENIDGGLIGGASLDVDSFVAICKSAIS